VIDGNNLSVIISHDAVLAVSRDRSRPDAAGPAGGGRAFSFLPFCSRAESIRGGKSSRLSIARSRDASERARSMVTSRYLRFMRSGGTIREREKKKNRESGERDKRGNRCVLRSLKAQRYSPSVSLMFERFLSALVTAAPLRGALFYRR